MADLDDIQAPAQTKKAAKGKKKAIDSKPPVTPRVADLNMDWGMKNRMSRIIRPASGRTVMLAVDHGYFLGPTSGLEDLSATVTPLMPYADALMPTRGGLRWCVNPATDTPIVLRASGANSILGELSDEELTVSIEDAVRMNCSAVAVSIYVGSENQHRTLHRLAQLVDEGNRYGMPVLAVTAVGKDMVRDSRFLSLASRLAAEMGAQIVKTYYCEGFERVINTCPVPVVMAGGKKLPEMEALTLTANAIKRGAAGVDMGRNIFQSDDPVAMIQAVRAVVHENMSPKKAYGIYEDIKAQNKRKRS